MQIVQFIPGLIVTPNAITIPVTAPDIEAVVSAQIIRLPNSLDAHKAGAVAVAHGAGVAAVVHAGATVKDHVFTQPGIHTLTPDAVGGITNALGEDGAGNLETAAAGPAVGMPTCIDAHLGGAVDAHTVTAQPNDHLQAAIVAALDDHAPGDIALALAAHVGATPVVAAVPTRLTARTISLSVSTALGDLLTLNYYEVGERVLVS